MEIAEKEEIGRKGEKRKARSPGVEGSPAGRASKEVTRTHYFFIFGDLRLLAALVLLWCVGVVPETVLACRYNVRDIGFVDLEAETYQLYALVREGSPGEVVSTLKEVATEMLAESNIRFEVVNIDKKPNHPATKHLPAGPRDAYPAGVLVSTEGRSLPVPLLTRGQPARQSIVKAMREVVSSPTREELTRQAGSAFGVVLLIEGSKADENQRVRKTVTGAMDQVKALMKTLPKSIAQPPVVVTVEAASFLRERILLWSLGWETNRATQALAAIVYGRARWMGPLMKGDEITEPNLTGLLSIIGADCECGMDLAWTQGTRLPAAWDGKRQREIARALGFDPENPLVKIEVSRIFGRRGTLRTAPMGYEEVALDGDGKAPAGPTNLTPDLNKVPLDEGRNTHKVETPLGTAEEAPLVGRSLRFLVGMAIVIAAVGLGIYLKATGNR